MNDKFLNLMAEALEIDVSEVKEDLALDPEENWDSIALLSVIAEIDMQYGVELDGEELSGCRKLSEVYDLISGS